MDEIILQMKGIEKHFSGVHALKSVQFELRAGEVHALTELGDWSYETNCTDQDNTGLHQHI